MDNTRIFLYMVIHDLKHPTDAIINQLQSLQQKLEDHLGQLDKIADKVIGIEQDFECLRENGRLLIDQQRLQDQQYRAEFEQSRNSSYNYSIDLTDSHNVPRSLEPHSNHSRMSSCANPIAKFKKEQLDRLQTEITSLFQEPSDIQHLGFLVNGDKHELKLTIQYTADDKNLIKKVTCENPNTPSKDLDLLSLLRLSNRRKSHPSKQTFINQQH